ncbi:MAG TPA: D-TA family PLP-dependent enzyme [Cyclobacteriaceae bacterium]
MSPVELDTPCIVIDLDKVEANIHRLQRYLDEHGIKNRPHIKTHKLPQIARMQVDAGAVGITCQKLGEAEVMADAGLDDILITYNILGAAKLQRLTHLAKRIRLSVIADSDVTVRGLSHACASADTEVGVMVEFESGKQRCGVQTPQEATTLARLITSLPGLRFEGLMTYPTTGLTVPFVNETRALLAAEGIEIPCVSGGGTPGLWEMHRWEGVTEHRAGTYVYGDRKIVSTGTMTFDEVAMHVLTTVVSRPTSDRGILDAGSKVLSSDTLDLDGFGYILEYPEARIYGQSEEHGHVDFSRCSSRPVVGEKVTVIPNHTCVVTNLTDEVVCVRNGKVHEVWPVAARGMVR